MIFELSRVARGDVGQDPQWRRAARCESLSLGNGRWAVPSPPIVAALKTPGGDLVVRSTGDIRNQTTQVGVIERIEHIASEAEAPAFRQDECLCERRIPIHQARPEQP